MISELVETMPVVIDARQQVRTRGHFGGVGQRGREVRHSGDSAGAGAISNRLGGTVDGQDAPQHRRL